MSLFRGICLRLLSRTKQFHLIEGRYHALPLLGSICVWCGIDFADVDPDVGNCRQFTCFVVVVYYYILCQSFALITAPTLIYLYVCEWDSVPFWISTQSSSITTTTATAVECNLFMTSLVLWVRTNIRAKQLCTSHIVGNWIEGLREESEGTRVTERNIGKWIIFRWLPSIHTCTMLNQANVGGNPQTHTHRLGHMHFIH